MLLYSYVLTLSLQINRMFPVHDVQHLLQERASKSNVIYTEFGDLKGYDCMIHSTRIPTHAILSYESDKLHIFLHDEERISRCVWDGTVRFDEKKDILKNMLTWWTKKHPMLDQRLINYEDGVVFAETLKELNE